MKREDWLGYECPNCGFQCGADCLNGSPCKEPCNTHASQYVLVVDKATAVLECVQQNMNNVGFVNWLYDMLGFGEVE